VVADVPSESPPDRLPPAPDEPRSEGRAPIPAEALERDAATEAAELPRRTSKRASAFRTIGEVAEELDLPAHVLRFWESKFPPLKPLKRGGGRRYYRPEDIVLLRRIRQCLYQDGYTIRGVQKLLRDGVLRGAAGAWAGPPGDGDGAADEPDDTATSDDGAPEDEAAGLHRPAAGMVPATLFPLDPEAPPPLQPARRPPARETLRAALEEARRELIEIRALVVALRGEDPS
jgi:DNA-binding transcriptional MerR regulator